MHGTSRTEQATPCWLRLRTFADSLHGAHFGAILHAVNGEIDFWEGLLLLYCANSVVDLDGARILRARRTSAIGIHVERRKIGEVGQERSNTRRG